VYYLFRLQRQLYEDLLQFLVDVVDTELLEAVLLKNLEAVDVENAYVDVLSGLSHGLVHCLEKPVRHTGSAVGS